MQIVVVSKPEWHLQTFSFGLYDPSISGACRAVVDRKGRPKMDERKVIAHRAFFEIQKSARVVNLGVGMPEGVAVMAAQYTSQNPAAADVTLTTEAGVMGGFPCGGLRFGTARNPVSHLPSDTMLDFYNGGGIDIAFLGMAEVHLGTMGAPSRSRSDVTGGCSRQRQRLRFRSRQDARMWRVHRYQPIGKDGGFHGMSHKRRP